MLCVAGVFVLGAFNILTDDIISTLVIQVMVMFALPFLLYTLFVSKSAKQTLSDAGFKKISLKTVLICFLLGITLYFVNNFVATFFQNLIALLGYETIGSSTTVAIDYKFYLTEFVLSTILPGFCEEFLHRGLLLNANKNTGNTRYCLIISSLLFGLMHLSIKQFFYAAILGALMGYVDIKADSIYPSMIMHFCNNFLSSYFYYGPKLNWPLAIFVDKIITMLYANIFIFILSATIFVSLLILLYIYLVKLIIHDRLKRNMQKFLLELELENLPIEEAQAKINQANIVLKQSASMHLNTAENNKKLGFKENIFVISAFVLGGLITICTFIWGII